jgi:hypothetical protein
MSLTVDILLYVNQVVAIRWQYHLILNWYVPIDCQAYAAKTTLSVGDPPVGVLQFHPQYHTVGRCLLQKEKCR